MQTWCVFTLFGFLYFVVDSCAVIMCVCVCLCCCWEHSAVSFSISFLFNINFHLQNDENKKTTTNKKKPYIYRWKKKDAKKTEWTNIKLHGAFKSARNAWAMMIVNETWCACIHPIPVFQWAIKGHLYECMVFSHQYKNHLQGGSFLT